MSNAQEAVKTRHKETSLIFPVLALVVLFLWGGSQTLPVVIAINLLALIGILSSAFSVVRHADVLAHRLGEPYGSLILSLSVVILEVSLISALMATGDAAPTLMRDTLYSIIMIVTGGLVGFSLLLGGRKFATQYMNLFGIKQYLIALFPLAIIVLVFPMALPAANFSTGQALLVALISAVKAVLNNQVQRAMNLFFGSVLATISLTVPVVTLIAFMTGNELQFALGAPEMVVMVASLVLCHISFSTGRTNVLNGAAHLALFAAYLMTIFA